MVEYKVMADDVVVAFSFKHWLALASFEFYTRASDGKEPSFTSVANKTIKLLKNGKVIKQYSHS